MAMFKAATNAKKSGMTDLHKAKPFAKWEDDKSRMKREFHVRFCERLEGKFLRPTRPVSIDITAGCGGQRAFEIPILAGPVLT